MKYGKFDDSKKEYLITTPFTPLPWINYLGNNGFFGLISNTGGGYAFYRDAKLMRITRFRYNNVPRDRGGRCYYIKDGDTIWSPSFLPANTPLDSYLCRHGLGYTIFQSSKNGVWAELECFVPIDGDCEINKLKLKNLSDKTKTLNVYGMAEWCLWNAVDDAANFQRNLNIGEVEIESNAVYHKTEYRERRSHYAFFALDTPFDGFDSDRDAFLGAFRGFECPAAVEKGTSFSSLASGWSPIAALRKDITLTPKEEFEAVFILGYAENPEDSKFTAPDVIRKDAAHKIMAQYGSAQKADTAFCALEAYWDNLLSTLSVKSGIPELDRTVNVWNQYQCMVTFNMSRSASYFESGTGRGMGFRDSCQDLLGFVHLIPERSRERILDIASIQFEDGSTYHQYQPLTKRGNGDVGSGFNDDPLWLVACTAAYIKETGDGSILRAEVPFDNAAGTEAPLFEHLRRSVNYTVNHKGPHGLPLIGRADWNDCLNLNCFSSKPGESFQTCANFESGKAESVFIAGMFVKYAAEYAELCKRFGSAEEADAVLAEVRLMEEAVLKFGWDGKWYLRAYDAFGNKIGSSQNEEGKIFIEPQGFCSMAGIGKKDGLCKTALKSAVKYLQNDYGMEILAPPYTKYHLELGEISSYPPGYKENGSVFCHNNPWVILGMAQNGMENEAYKLYKSSCPAFIENASDVHRTEPYIYSQTIAGRSAPRYGEAKNSWLTGTASWMMVAISQGILGICPDFDGLRISPCLPDCIDGYTAQRRFRGRLYKIQVRRDAHKKGVYANGKRLTDNLIPLDGEKGVCEVEVFI
jgi:cellobiose phosphorylase